MGFRASLGDLTEHEAVKFVKKLLGDNDVEAVLQRLDRLALEEARMTATQTLGVVHGLVQNIRAVMDGEKFHVDCQSFVVEHPVL